MDEDLEIEQTIHQVFLANMIPRFGYVRSGDLHYGLVKCGFEYNAADEILHYLDPLNTGKISKKSFDLSFRGPRAPVQEDLVQEQPIVAAKSQQAQGARLIYPKQSLDSDRFASIKPTENQFYTKEDVGNTFNKPDIVTSTILGAQNAYNGFSGLEFQKQLSPNFSPSELNRMSAFQPIVSQSAFDSSENRPSLSPDLGTTTTSLQNVPNDEHMPNGFYTATNPFSFTHSARTLWPIDEASSRGTRNSDSINSQSEDNEEEEDWLQRNNSFDSEKTFVEKPAAVSPVSDDNDDTTIVLPGDDDDDDADSVDEYEQVVDQQRIEQSRHFGDRHLRIKSEEGVQAAGGAATPNLLVSRNSQSMISDFSDEEETPSRKAACHKTDVADCRPDSSVSVLKADLTKQTLDRIVDLILAESKKGHQLKEVILELKKHLDREEGRAWQIFIVRGRYWSFFTQDVDTCFAVRIQDLVYLGWRNFEA